MRATTIKVGNLYKRAGSVSVTRLLGFQLLRAGSKWALLFLRRRLVGNL